MDIKEAIRIINYVANQAHSRYLTVGFGLILVFQEKANEATDYIAAGYPTDLSNWPFIHAEAHATGKTSKNAANDIIKTKSEWVAIAVKIEEIRVKSITKIKKPRTNIDKEVKHAIQHLEEV